MQMGGYSNLLTSNAIFYTWRQLLQRCGLKDFPLAGNNYNSHGICFKYGSKVGDEDLLRYKIIVMPCNTGNWTQRPANSKIKFIPKDDCVPSGINLPFDEPIPVLFWGSGYEDGHKPFAEKTDDKTIVFYADIIAAVFFMLSRLEEVDGQEGLDEHKRFPAKQSFAYKQGFLDRPIVDQYALILQAWIKLFLPDWEPTQSQFAIRLTHDIDIIKRFENLADRGRALLGDIIKRQNINLFN